MRIGSTDGSVSASCQRRAWRQACAQDVAAERHDQPVSSASGTNSGGRDEPAHRMLPAHSASAATMRPCQRDDRLVLDDHLARARSPSPAPP